jgi:RNA polymerase sigma-70 factor (ECF subfamily)
VLSDVKLVQLAKRGDVEAFEAICRRYERSALAAALTGLRDLQLAEDIVQESLLIAFKKITTLRDESKFASWLMTITHRQVIHALRSRKHPVSVSLKATETESTVGSSIETWIENEHLLDLVARLPERERVLIGLRFFDGYNFPEIAEITNRPLGTVTKQTSRALARLRSWSNGE